MDAPESKRGRYCPTPGWLVYGLLVVEGLLWLSERYRWFWFNEKKGWTVLIAVTGVGVVLASMLLWWLVALVLRWRFQFGIRTLLVLVVAVALPCSWLGVEIGQAKREREAAASLEKLGGSVERWSPDHWGTPSGPQWLCSVLGDNFFDGVWCASFPHTQVTDAGLEHLKGLSHLNTLNLDRTRVSDAGLKHLKGWSQLQCLSLVGTQVTDAGLEYLKELGQLNTLSLGGTQITDAGLEHLRGLSQLHVLWLTGTQVTDAQLERLKGLSRLQELRLNDTRVTDAGVKKLQQALPNCYIHR